MTEQMLNEIVESVVNALKVRRMIINEKEVFDLMRHHENIHQIVISKFCSEKKARFIIRELKEMSGKKKVLLKRVFILFLIIMFMQEEVKSKIVCKIMTLE